MLPIVYRWEFDMGRWLRRVNYLLRRRRRDAELDEEIQHHRDLLQRELQEQGLTSADAVRRGRLALGNVTLNREDARAVWIPPSIESIWQDAHYAFRSLGREPGFALLALVTLALGIGATTAMFSVVYAIALKPLPYVDPDRLVMIWSTNRDGTTQGASLPDLHDWQAQSRSFDAMATYQVEKPIFTGGPSPRSFPLAAVSPSLFETLGVRAWRGRTLTASDVAIGRGIAVVSYDTWQELGADPALVGGVLHSADGPVAIVGVMPPGFQFPYRRKIAVWVPMADEHGMENNRRARGYAVVARLAQHATLDQAQHEMDLIAARLATAYPATNDARGVRLVPLLLDTVGAKTRTTLLVLFGAAGCVLLIACANVATCCWREPRVETASWPSGRQSAPVGRG